MRQVHESWEFHNSYVRPITALLDLPAIVLDASHILAAVENEERYGTVMAQNPFGVEQAPRRGLRGLCRC